MSSHPSTINFPLRQLSSNLLSLLPHFFIFETPQRSTPLLDHLSFDGSSIFLLPSEPGHRLISPRCDRVFGGCERGKRGGVKTRRRRSTLRQAISLSGKRDNQFRASEFRRRRQKQSANGGVYELYLTPATTLVRVYVKTTREIVCVPPLLSLFLLGAAYEMSFSGMMLLKSCSLFFRVRNPFQSVEWHWLLNRVSLLEWIYMCIYRMKFL